MYFNPTDEQKDIVDEFLKGNHLVVQAGAGTGKTSTIELLAKQSQKQGQQGLYFAFNKSIVDDVKKKLSGTDIQPRTFHSVALEIAKKHPKISVLLSKMGNKSLRPKELAEIFFVRKHFTYISNDDFKISAGNDSVFLSSAALCGYARNAVIKFCQSSDDKITRIHVPSVKDMPDKQVTEFQDAVLPIARRMWADLLDPAGIQRIEHDHYLKFVSLEHVDLRKELGLNDGDVIFFDEAQDARPCMTSMVLEQAYRNDLKDGLQIVALGDSAQAIYATFTGARDALPEFSLLPDSVVLPLTTSWRFGESVADVANSVLDLLDADIRLKGNPNVNSFVHGFDYEEGPDGGAPDAVLVRTNDQMVLELLRYQSWGLKVCASSDKSSILTIVDDVERIIQGQRPRSADMFDFKEHADIAEFVESEFSEPTLRSLLSLILKNGVDNTRKAFDNTVTERRADVFVSTIHKSKGRQWPRVAVVADPVKCVPKTIPDTFDYVGREKLMLLYVAFTRAQEELIVPYEILEALNNLAATGEAGFFSDSGVYFGQDFSSRRTDALF